MFSTIEIERAADIHASLCRSAWQIPKEAPALVVKADYYFRLSLWLAISLALAILRTMG